MKQQIKESILEILNEKSKQQIDEARPYPIMYSADKWYELSKPINFLKEYPDFKNFLMDDSIQSAIGWVDPQNKDNTEQVLYWGFKQNLFKVLPFGAGFFIPNHIKHGGNQVLSWIMKKLNKYVPSLVKAFGGDLFEVNEFTPKELYQQYLEALKKKDSDRIRDLQFVLQYEYEKWKAQQGKSEIQEEKPCWKGHEQVGLKVKMGKKVPNCVPVDESYVLAEGELAEFQQKLSERVIEEAEYQGKKVTLNKPIRTSDGPKKFKVYVKDGDKVKMVRFGDPNMKIKKSNPKRRKSFRARHNCDNPGPKTKARFWSCKAW